ncbi:MAG TPA: DUF177 domain-containing protein [Candidatus Limnocylindrales bacterium]|nr:DUF177 domain-containing protein [Candidatus Limnocylindrales bacterium]
MTVPAPLTFPLAGLLGEPPGSERRYEIHGATIRLPEDMRLTEPLDGELRVSRTNRGVLVDATISTAMAGTCSRCLRDIEVPMTVTIRDEVLPSVDIATGHEVDASTEPDATRLSTHHELDLGAMAADAISLEEPIVALCEEACPGLCVECGERLGPEHVEHEVDDIDPRMAALKGFRVDGDGESG